MIELTWGIYEINSWSTADLSLMANNVVYEVYFESNIALIRYFKGIKYNVATDKLYFVGVDDVSYEVTVPALTLTIYRTTMVDDALRDFFLQGSDIIPLLKRKIETPQIYYSNGVITLRPVMFADRYGLFLNGKKISEGRLNSLTTLKGNIIPKSAGFIYQKFFNVQPNNSYYFGFSTYRNYENSAQDSLNVRYGYLGSYVDLGVFELNDSLKYKNVSGNNDFLDVWWKYQNDSSYNKFVGDHIDKVYVFPTRIPIDTEGLPTGQVTVKIYSDDERFEESDFSNVIDYKSSFFLKLYNFNCETNVVDKTEYLSELSTRRGTFREETSILNPSIEVESEEIPVGNYAYFGYFNRYYFVKNITSVRKNLWRIDMSVDVLMTNRSDIAKQSCLIGRNEFEWNDFLVDEEVLSEDRVSIYSFNGSEFKSECLYSISGGLTGRKEYTWDFNNFYHMVVVLDAKVFIRQDTTDFDRYYSYNISNTSQPYFCDVENDYLRLMQDFLNPDWWESFKSTFSNPSDFWAGNYLIPLNLSNFKESAPQFPFSLTDRTTMAVGLKVISDENYRAIGANSRIRFWSSFNGISLQDFTDLSPLSEYQLYIPYVGIVDVDGKFLIHGYDTLVYDLDILTGDISVTLVKKTTIDDMFDDNIDFYMSPLIPYPYQWKGNMYVELPIGRTNKNEQHLANTTTAIETTFKIAETATTYGMKNDYASKIRKTKKRGSAAMARNIEYSADIGLADSAFDTASGLVSSAFLNNVPKGSVNGVVGSILSGRNVNTPILFKIESSVFYPANYNHLYGRPLLQTRTLGSLKGFTVVDSCHLIGFNCTADEMAEIERLLLSGVIL